MSRANSLDLENDPLFSGFYLNEAWTPRAISIKFKELLGEDEMYKALAMELWMKYSVLPYLSFVLKHYENYTDNQICYKVMKSLRKSVAEVTSLPWLVMKFSDEIPERRIPVFWLISHLDNAYQFRIMFSLPEDQKRKIIDEVKEEIEAYVTKHPELR